MGGPPHAQLEWQDAHPHAVPRDGIHAPLTIFLSTLSTSLSNKLTRSPSKSSSTVHWTRAAAPPVIKHGPPPLTSEILSCQPLNLREKHFPNVYCKGFRDSVGNVSVDKSVIAVEKTEDTAHGIAIGNGLAPLARAVDQTASHSLAKVVQRGRLVQLKIEKLAEPRFKAKWLRRIWPQRDTMPSFLGGISIALSKNGDLRMDCPLELHPDTVCVSDDLSVWVQGQKVRDRFDAKYTDQGITFEQVRRGQIVSVLFAINRVVVYSDKWPLLSFAFDAEDSDYRKILSDGCAIGRWGKLDGDVWPIVQLTPPAIKVHWHSDNPEDPLRALQFHRLMSKQESDVEEGRTLRDGNTAIRDLRCDGNWEPRTITNNTCDIWSKSSKTRTSGSTYVSTARTWRSTMTHVWHQAHSSFASGAFQWRKLPKSGRSYKEEESMTAQWYRITMARWVVWGLVAATIVVLYFFYFPYEQVQPWNRNWVFGLILLMCLTLICLLPHFLDRIGY